MKKITILFNGGTVKEILSDGVVIEYDPEKTKRDLWENRFEMWLESEGTILDTKAININKNKFQG